MIISSPPSVATGAVAADALETTIGLFSTAIMTDTDREHVSEQGDPSDQQVDQSVYRVRQRINEELPEDIAVLKEHRPDLLDELRDVVCDS